MKYEYKINLDNKGLMIFDKTEKYKIDLRERLLDFTVNTIQFLGTLPNKNEYNVFKNQISKSASSMGANLPREILVFIS